MRNLFKEFFLPLAVACGMASLMSMMLCQNAIAQESPCQDVSTVRNQGLLIDKSGSYCLTNDIQIDNANPFAMRRDRPGYVVEILYDDITLDLQGHTMHIGDATDGLVIRADGRTYRKGQVRPSRPKRVAIRNGTLESVTWGISSGLYNGLIPSDLGDPLANVSKSNMSAKEIAEMAERFRKLHLSMLNNQTKLRPKTAGDYAQRDIHLENLHISVNGVAKGAGAGGGAINIEGAGTVIRNCVIETNDGNAIWIFGPNAVIENNTIIVHGTHQLSEADAAIRLIQADGAIIRNNKIIIKGDANRRGISTFDTGPITVEGNTFYGMTAQDDIAKAFIGTLQMKESDNHFEPAWKTLFGAQ